MTCSGAGNASSQRQRKGEHLDLVPTLELQPHCPPNPPTPDSDLSTRGQASLPLTASVSF